MFSPRNKSSTRRAFCGFIDGGSIRAVISNMDSKPQFPAEPSVEGEVLHQDDAFRD